MRHDTGIQWTHVPGYVGATWNPTTGCSRVSPGCDHCYAFTLHDQRHVANRNAARAAMAPLTNEPRYASGRFVIGEARATGITLPMPEQYDAPFSTVQLLDEKRLTEPLRARKPHAYFVDSMADLFHDDVPDAFLDRVFAVMSLAPQHIFMVLTKRPERLRSYLVAGRSKPVGEQALALAIDAHATNPRSLVGAGTVLTGDVVHLRDWPLSNVWLGVSAEDQQRADERLPLLLDTPAAVRFVSVEPQLGAVDLRPFGDLGWVICGGESGAGARPFDIAWARGLRDQCREAATPFFMKQVGGHVVDGLPEGGWPSGTLGGVGGGRLWHPQLRNRSGSDPAEWPDDLRVREWPAGDG